MKDLLDENPWSRIINAVANINERSYINANRSGEPSELVHRVMQGRK